MPALVREAKGTPYQTFIGIDPGVSGGLAILAYGGPVVVPMPKTDKEVWSCVSGYVSPLRPNIFACIELVSGWVGGHNRGEGDDGTTSNPGSAMFTFGQSYGALRMALTAAGIPFEAVRPQAWQKALGISRPPGFAGGKWKTYLRDRARGMFPELKVTKATCDALLIAEFCRRKWSGIMVQ